MKKIISILLLTYYSFGIVLLPMGDFSIVQDLPEMYQHCKVNEDHDMTPLDFVTDHLLNIDGFFDKHDNGDGQKPHSPTHLHHQSHIVAFQSTVSFIFEHKITYYPESTLRPIFFNSFIKSDYISKIFRPPIVA